MKSVKLKENLHKEAERVSKTLGVKVQDIIPKALKQGLVVLKKTMSSNFTEAGR